MTVVSLIAVERLARILLVLRLGGGVLGWRGLVVVLVAEAAEPSALVVLGLLALVVVVVGRRTIGHPSRTVHGLHAATAATTVADARPDDEECDEEDDDDGG